MRPLDLAIIATYLVTMVVIGIACRGRQDDADDYFTTRGGMSGRWGSLLVGLSLAATLFSGSSFVAYPSITFEYGLKILAILMTLPGCYFLLRFWFLPRFLSAGHLHPYDLIEDRFGRKVRLTASWMFIFLRLGWMATLIYAPTLLILAAFRLPTTWIWPLVIVTGLISTVYTVFGGIRGVIVTDAIQMVVIMAGIAASVGFIFIRLGVPFSELVSGLESSGHLVWADLSLNPQRPFTLLAILVGVSVSNLGSYMADQMSLQRYLVTGTVQASARSFLINIIGAAFVIGLLFLVGMALVAWFARNPTPELMGPSGKMMADKVFPYFVAHHLPTGLSGLLIAAILAATMSSLTSGINALSGALTGDVLRARVQEFSPHGQLRIARLLSFFIGLLATIAAGFVPLLGTFYEVTQVLLGLFVGPLLACVILSSVRWQVPSWSMLVGMLFGILAGAAAKQMGVHALWVSPTTFGVAILIPLFCRFLFRVQPINSSKSSLSSQP